MSTEEFKEILLNRNNPLQNIVDFQERCIKYALLKEFGDDIPLEEAATHCRLVECANNSNLIKLVRVFGVPEPKTLFEFRTHVDIFIQYKQ